MSGIKEVTKQAIVTALLWELEKTPLKKMTIQQIVKRAGISKQTFYNYFKDKEELIYYVYESLIIPEFDPKNFPEKFGPSFKNALLAMKEHGQFMKQALLMEGQNNLKGAITGHCEQFDLAYHMYLLQEPLDQSVRLATIYHANASSAMTFSWILGGFVTPIDEMVRLICEMRRIGMDEKIAQVYEIDE